MLQAWDSYQGLERDRHHCGGLYVIRSGRGACHDEKPMTENGFMHQFQLWMLDEESGFFTDADAEDPTTQLFRPDEIPIVEVVGDNAPLAKVRVMSGENIFGVSSPVTLVKDLIYLHVHMAECGKLDVPIPAGFSGLIYVPQGSLAA